MLGAVFAIFILFAIVCVIDKLIKNIKKKFKRETEIKKVLVIAMDENTYHKPEMGETYYYIGRIGNVCTDTWHDDNVNHALYNFGNCFLDKQEAEKEARARKITNNLNLMARHGKDDGVNCEITHCDGDVGVLMRKFVDNQEQCHSYIQIRRNSSTSR